MEFFVGLIFGIGAMVLYGVVKGYRKDTKTDCQHEWGMWAKLYGGYQERSCKKCGLSVRRIL